MGMERNLSDTAGTSGTVEAMWGTDKEPTGKAVGGGESTPSTQYTVVPDMSISSGIIH